MFFLGAAITKSGLTIEAIKAIADSSNINTRN